MINFSYQAITESGRNISGTVEADSVEMVENFLLSKGYIPSRVRAMNTGVSTGGSLFARVRESMSDVKISDLILFTKQFRSMMQAGVPILRLLQVLENQSENKTLKSVV